MKKILINKMFIKNFRGIKNIELDFNENENWIEGKNGSGKSTILDAIKYMLFTNSDNIYYIDLESRTSKEKPDIKIKMQIDKENFSLCTNKGIWLIDGVKYKDNKNYKIALSKKIGLENINSIYTNILPFELFKTLNSQNTDDTKELKKTMISIINEENNGIIDSEKIDNISDEIKLLENNLKTYRSDIKDKKNIYEILLKEHPTINFKNDISEKNIFLNKEKESIQNSIFEYENLQTQIEINKSKIKEYKNKIDLYNEDYKYKNKKEFKMSFFKILLTILTLGIYYILWRKKMKKHSSVNDFIERSKEKKLIEKELEKYKEKNIEDNQKIMNIDIIELRKELDNIKSQMNISDDDKEIILKVKNREKELNDLKEKEQETSFNIQEKIEERNKYYLKISELMKKTFQNFDIDITSKDNYVVFKNNGIEWRKLNKSLQMNLIYQLNDFLKKKNNLNTFSLIDNAESINKISTSPSTQYIICKVNNKDGISLNGKNIN